VGAGRSTLDDPDAVALANPINYVDGGEPPFLILHGTADTIISPSQTLLLHTALRAAGVDSTRYLLAGANHGDLVFLGDVAAGLPWTTREVLDRAVAFLSSHLAGRSRLTSPQVWESFGITVEDRRVTDIRWCT
jgi:dipeptidyl aminopeptidase/acylaminoacyl peptidase